MVTPTKFLLIMKNLNLIGIYLLKSNKYSEIFIQQGIEPHRLLAAGFGENYPIDNNETPTAYQKNRRIEIKLTTR